MAISRHGLAAVLVVLAAGCGRGKLGPADAGGPDAKSGDAGDAREAATTDASDDAATSDAEDVQSDVAPEADASDAVAATPARVYETFVLEREEVQRDRFVDCFGASHDTVATWNFTGYPGTFAEDIRLGLAVVDPATLAACLETARTATCAAVAAGAIEAACDHVLVGTVPDGRFCLSAEDCAGPGAHSCMRSAGKCAAVCVKGSLTGRTPVAEGVVCPSGDDCGPGFYCRRNGPKTFQGVCAARAAGNPCDGEWACSFPYTCVFDGAGVGTCGVGRAVGEPCRLYSFDALNGPHDDCAISLACYPNAQGEFRCGEGVNVGEACGGLPPPQPDSNGGFIPCRTGLCDPDSSTRKCVPFREEGEACTAYYQCDRGLDCYKGTCRLPSTEGAPEGADCGGVELSSCAGAAYCAIDETDVAPFPRGTCRPFVADGQPCDRPQACGAASTCVAGFCASCR